MIVYEATKELFVKDVIENNIANRIEQLYRLRVGQKWKWLENLMKMERRDV